MGKVPSTFTCPIPRVDTDLAGEPDASIFGLEEVGEVPLIFEIGLIVCGEDPPYPGGTAVGGPLGRDCLTT